MDDNKTAAICISALLVAIVAIVVSFQIYFSKQDARWVDCLKNEKYPGECARLKCVDDSGFAFDKRACMVVHAPAAQ